MGVYPSSFTGFFDASVGALVQHHAQAIAVPTGAPAGRVVKLAGHVP
jgi:hypothetical protein